jgi:SAM-dependent methyltransferase
MITRRTDDSQGIERQAAHFEKIAGAYYAARSNASHLAFKNVLWKHFFLRNAFHFSKSHTRVLEPMCGYGEGRKIIGTHLGQPSSYTGFDFSMEMVNKARQSYPADIIFQQDITTYEPRDQHDILIIIGGLHHVYSHADRVLKILYKAARPGGLFINFEPTHNNFAIGKIREQIYNRNPFFENETERGFELKELNSHFAAAGFTLADQIYPGLLAYILYYNPDAFPKLLKGGPRFARLFTIAESIMWQTYIAKKSSFATLSLWRK